MGNKVFGFLRSIILGLILFGAIFHQLESVESDDFDGSLIHEKKIVALAKVNKFPMKFSHMKYDIGHYILEDGYAIYYLIQHNSDPWNVGDMIVVTDPHKQFDEKGVRVEVENHITGEKEQFTRVGFADPATYRIVDKKHLIEENGSTVVMITLDNETTWKFTYNDETPTAKSWHKGDEVQLFIDLHEKQAESPFPVERYLPHWTYEIVNLDSKKHFSGEHPEYVEESSISK